MLSAAARRDRIPDSLFQPPGKAATIPVFQSSEGEPDRTALDEIQTTIQQQCNEVDQGIKLILAGDFNRQHPAWSNRAIPTEFTERPEELMKFFSDLPTSVVPATQCSG
jgi:hypothetical protein